MDTEKKVQFVALTKEEIDAMIQQAALAGAQVASDAMIVGQRKSEKEKIDRRLHNTDLLPFSEPDPIHGRNPDDPAGSRSWTW